jgi:pyruvate dehydrogenase E2 component (dihydrolipoamide acetyltransferase)
MIEFKVPDLGENIESAEVLKVLVSEGDTVEAEQPVIEVETDKAAFEVPVSHAGRVAKVHVKEGDSIAVGQTALTLEEGSGAAESAPAANKEPPAKAEAKAPKPQAPEPKAEPEPKAAPSEAANGRAEPRPAAADGADQAAAADRRPAPAAPATRRLARELGIDVAQVQGTGPHGRITPEDVKNHVRQGARGAAGPSIEAPKLPAPESFGEVERVRMSKLGRTAAERLSYAWQTIPHVTQHDLADITALEAARRQYNERRPSGEAKLTATALAVKACVAALKQFPQFNASFDQQAGEIIYKRYYHIGIAVDTEHGLLVPVVRDADRKSTREIAAELERLAEKARDRSLSSEEMQGGTFTITNLGGLGGTAFTPIVNYPEVAILGVSRSRVERYPADEGFEDRLVMPLSLSYDHRVINGADAVRFVRYLIGLLKDPIDLLMGS